MGTELNTQGVLKRADAELCRSYLQVGCEGVWKSHVAGEGTQDQVPQLDAVGRDDITEAIMVVTQELWEIMEQDQKHTEGALVVERGMASG